MFLCELTTLREWKVAVFYENNEMEFDMTKKRVNMEVSKGGYELAKLEPLREWSQERSIMYVNLNNVYLQKGLR